MDWVSKIQRLFTRKKTSGSLPQHIAIIMDGNGRWARNRLLPVSIGHNEGAKAGWRTVEMASSSGIKVLTVFAFSTENWMRLQDEVNSIILLAFKVLPNHLPKIQKLNIKLRVIGDLSRVTPDQRAQALKCEELTKNNSGMILVVALSYSGRWDIVNAVNQILDESSHKNNAKVTEESFENYLSTSDIPPPDLLIRTGGEKRISNFLLWQMAYTEFYFCDVLWPDFDEHEFYKALEWFKSRERKFGLRSVTR